MNEQANQRKSGNVSRRRVLQASAVTAIGGMTLVGNVSAHKPFEIRFCGCSRICVHGKDGDWGRVWIATDGGLRQTRLNYSDCLSPDGKVIAFEFREGSAWYLACNPSPCANAEGEQDALLADDRLNADGCGLPGDVTVRTNQCREFWDGRGNNGNRGRNNRGGN